MLCGFLKRILHDMGQNHVNTVIIKGPHVCITILYPNNPMGQHHNNACWNSLDVRTYPRIVPGPQRVWCTNLVLEALALLRHAGSLIPEEKKGSEEA